jgi:hypothetical protein
MDYYTYLEKHFHRYSGFAVESLSVNESVFYYIGHDEYYY